MILGTAPGDVSRSCEASPFPSEVHHLTREELLEAARRAYEAHPETAVTAGDDPLLAFLLNRIDQAYDPRRPVESAKDALQHVVMALFVMLTALYAL